MTLENKIHQAQLLDAGIKKIKENLALADYKSFTLDDQGTVFFEGHPIVTKHSDVRELVLK